ncbi:hypothetical protein BDV28DRAFT_162910 [Aspergillus coremiiformis]|uniref:F-box domain-containing protein n=1 Tax=Aspergillus coremiiformis TaxID=138285 RepID=A0A5N6ZF07_9EURO|nr:hypothetical protein BDV28DRAFT_162910 [Aspergillus coremiiformis]
MDSREHFCNICGGPLSNVFFESTYDQRLINDDASWLRWTRIVRPNFLDDNVPDDEGAYVISMLGTYHYEEGRIFRLDLNGLDQMADFAAWDEGFLVHGECFLILSDLGMLSKPIVTQARELFLRMEMRVPFSDQSVINWGDHGLYGGAGLFHGHRWIPAGGYEWLIASPEDIPDFTELLDGSIDDELWSDTKEDTVDPFKKIPTELCHIILNMLPSESIFAVMRASREFYQASYSLPSGYWRSMIVNRMPWIDFRDIRNQLGVDVNKIDYKTLAARLTEATFTFNGRNGPRKEFLCLQNRRRIWTCVERILADIAESVAKKDIHGRVSNGIIQASTFRMVTIQHRDSLLKKNADIYLRPDLTQHIPPKKLTVYFETGSSIVGIEVLLEGEASGLLLGHRTNFLQSTQFPPGAVINGFVLSLGPRPENYHEGNHHIHGLAIIVNGNYQNPHARLGAWTDNDMYHVLCARPLETLVGFTGQYANDGIVLFGIMVADLITGTPGYVWEMEDDVLATTRWTGHWPSPDDDPGTLVPNLKRVIIGFKTEGPVQFVHFRSRIIQSIQAFFPFGFGVAIGGLLFTFCDGTQELVGKAENHASVPNFIPDTILFDPVGNQRITAISVTCFERPEHRFPWGVNSIAFVTAPQGNNLILGYRGLQNVFEQPDSPYEYHGAWRAVVGMQFVIEFGMITQLGLVH